MFCSRNRLHEWSLRINYSDYTSSFEQLLKIDGSTNIHQQNLKALATEIYKVLNNLSPLFMRLSFNEKNVTYNSRSNATMKRDNGSKIHCTKKRSLKIPKESTTHCGIETIRRMGPIISNFVPEEMKNVTSLDAFKKQAKQFRFDICPCKICKQCIQGVGYLD